MFQITVKDSTGSAVPLTRYGELTRVPRSFASYAVRIEPNHGLGYVVDLRHTFDLTLAGRYSVQVSTKSASLDRLTIEDVVSNTTEFEVKGKRLPPIQKFIAVEEPEKPAAPSANPHSNLDDIPEGFEEIRIE